MGNLDRKQVESTLTVLAVVAGVIVWLSLLIAMMIEVFG